jgi:hypothetical protein
MMYPENQSVEQNADANDEVSSRLVMPPSALSPATPLGPDELEYRALVHRLASARTDQRIPNGKAIHAAIVLEAMFARASAEMRVFSGALSPATYDVAFLREAARRFLKRPGTSLKVLIQERLREVFDRPFLRELIGFPGLSVRFALGAYARPDAKHIAVMDSVGYRFELDHSNTSAVANFNEPRVAMELASVFDRAFSIAEPA